MDSKKQQQVCVLVCVWFTDLDIISAKKYFKIIIKTISCCYILRMLTQEYAEDFHAKNMANQSNCSFLCWKWSNIMIATAYKLMQLKT